MATARVNRGRIPSRVERTVDPIEVVVGSKGVNYISPNWAVTDGFAKQLTNLTFEKGVLRTRNGINTVGPLVGASVALSFRFKTSTNKAYLVRCRYTGVDIFNESTNSWDAVSGITLNGSKNNQFSYAGWGDEILLTNGVDGLWQINPVGLTATKIVDAPRGFQVTVWASRVFIVDSGMIYWTVKLDSLDWTGEGSGFEDLRSTPEGIIGSTSGLYPITDESALLIRNESVWVVNQTGNAIAPFRFNRLHSDLGSSSPFGITTVPGGIFGLFNDGIYYVTLDSVKQIGMPIDKYVLENLRQVGRSWATYDPYNHRSFLLVKELSTSIIWMYDWEGNRWTRYEYSVSLNTIEYDDYKKGSITIGQLTGTIGSLTGTIGELGLTSYQHGLMMTDDSWIYREDSTVTFDSVGLTSSSPTCTFVSGIIIKDPRKIATIDEMVLVYESNVPTVIQWYISYDGVNWVSWSSSQLLATMQPAHVRVRGAPRQGNNMMLKGVISGVGNIRLESLELMASKDADA